MARRQITAELDQADKQLKQTANTRTLNSETLELWDSNLEELAQKLDTFDQHLKEMNKSLEVFDSSTADKKPTNAFEMVDSQLKQLKKALKMKNDSVSKCRDLKTKIDNYNNEIDDCFAAAKSEASLSNTTALEDLDYSKSKIEKILENLIKSKIDSSLKDGKSALKVFPSTDETVKLMLTNFAKKAEELDALRGNDRISNLLKICL